eukprot:1980101-Rhodomonas_salina.1
MCSQGGRDVSDGREQELMCLEWCLDVSDLGVKQLVWVGSGRQVADAWDSYRLVELAGERRWDAVMVDVGGLSGHDGVLEAVALLRQLTSAMPSVRAIVIKSACMRALASSFLPANELLPALQPPAPAPP